MHPIKIITVEKSRELEQLANDSGLTFAQMMENAGRATALAIARKTVLQDKRVLVLIGPGNNGGDGLVAAHHLQEMGARVTCFIWRRKANDDANYLRVQGDGLPVVCARDDPGYRALHDLVLTADVVVDALLGVGVSRPIGGSLKDLLDAVREAVSEMASAHGLSEVVPRDPRKAGPLVVAVDCPTGLDCGSGELDPAALFADVTVTFAHPKVGLLRFPGADAVGDLVVADIGIPEEFAADIRLEMAVPQSVQPTLPRRPHSAHKGTFGRVLVVAGSVNYTGAAILAGGAAARVGAGLVTMAIPMPIHAAVASCLAEATYLLLPHDLGVLAAGAVEVLQDHSAGYEALLVGPGLTQETETAAFVYNLLGFVPAGRRGRIGFVSGSAAAPMERPRLPPLVLDADALNILAHAERWWTALPAQTILTPHPGEMARLIGGGVTVKDVQEQRESTAERMAQVWGTVVVLKGAFTVVAAPDKCTVLIPFANPGLATAGSGDVLAGAIAGLRAQGLGAFEAAVAGAYLHGLAGELTRADMGDMGMVAGDLLPRLPLALRRIRQGQGRRTQALHMAAGT